MILLGYATNESNMSNIEYNRISNHLKMVNTTIPKQQSTIIIISDHMHHHHQTTRKRKRTKPSTASTTAIGRLLLRLLVFAAAPIYTGEDSFIRYYHRQYYWYNIDMYSTKIATTLSATTRTINIIMII